jgi:Tol biopolymer transport system component
LRLPIDDGGLPQPLSPPVQGRLPAISRRGDRLAYMRLLEDLNIWRVEVPGPNKKASEPVNLISSTYMDGFPQYSPDGKRAVSVSDRSGHAEIWVCASDSSNAQQLTSLGAAGSPRWSPEGHRIVFDSNVEGQFELYMIDADGGSPKRMTNDPADDGVASWSRDGRWIYFASNRTKEMQVWKMPADGGEAVQVTKHGGYVAFESLDSKFVYFSKDLWGTSIWRIPAGGDDETNIVKSAGGGFAVASRGIYFIAPHSDGSSVLQFHNFATGKVTTVAAIHRRIAGGLSVSPDERYVLYTQADQSGTDLMLVEHFR